MTQPSPSPIPFDPPTVVPDDDSPVVAVYDVATGETITRPCTPDEAAQIAVDAATYQAQAAQEKAQQNAKDAAVAHLQGVAQSDPTTAAILTLLGYPADVSEVPVQLGGPTP